MTYKNTFKVAFCGVISALALVLMICTGLIPVGTYAFPCIAGFLLTTIVIEFGEKWSYLAFAVISILSIFLVIDKEAVVYFIAFLGFYPTLKSSIERLKHKALQYIIKYAVFNICIIGAFLVAKFILMIPDEEFTIAGFYVPWAFLIIGNGLFYFYDVAITMLVINYVRKIRNKIFK